MSYQYSVTERRRRTAASGGYGASSNRSTFGYWVPLVLTVGAAAVGVAAWIWSERREDEEDSDQEHYTGGVPPPGYASMSGAMPPGPGPMGMQSTPQGPGNSGPPQQGGFRDGQQGPPTTGFQGPPPPGWQSGDMYGASRSTGEQPEQDSGLVARMSSALGMGRASTPNPTLNWASQQVAAGFAAAGAMVGGALSSAREGDQGEYRDHERWSEEAEHRDSEREVKQGIQRRGTADEYFSGAVEMPSRALSYKPKRKNIAIVVSAVDERGLSTEIGHHASMLAHLPEQINPDTTRVFVLIYAPDLKSHPRSTTAQSPRAPRSQSMASSFSNISHPDDHDHESGQNTPAHTPGEFPSSSGGILTDVDPAPISSDFDTTSTGTSTLYKTLHNQARALVERDTMVIPFTTSKGHKHILKSLSPETVYIQESLCGTEGELVSDLSGWVRQIIVVVGDEGGAGGLVDTDDEVARKGRGSDGKVWWQREERTGLGKRVAIVESLKIDDDWRRRVNEKD